MAVKKRHNLAANILTICLLVTFCALLFQVARIQIFDHEKYNKLADSQHWTRVNISARRGPILDRNGVKLADSIRVSSVFADPVAIKNKRGSAEKLAELLNKNPDDIHKLLKKNKRFVWIKRKLSNVEEIGVKRLKLRGVYTRYEYERSYLNNELLSHVIGATDIDGKGIEGVEYVFNDQLNGEDGYLVVERDGHQRHITNVNSAGVQPSDGAGVMLTIDSVIQKHVEDELEAAFKKRKPLAVIGVVMDVRNGEILAMANRPTFNPNKSSRFKASDRRNRAITDCYEPGSIMKPVIMGALFNNNLASPDEEIFCHNGAYKMGSRVLHDSHPYGDLSVTDVIVKSSNIGMAQLAARLDQDKLYGFLENIGFGSKLKIGLPGEIGGILRPLSGWTKYTVPSIAMGHEIAVTPLQFTAAFSCIANGGTLYRPSIAKAITSNDGKVVIKNLQKRSAIRRVMSNEVARDMLNPMLTKVVKEGTGKKAALDNFQVAGKTGTAQKLEAKGYSHSKFVGSFVAYAPADNPRVCVLVMVDEPKGQYYGGTVAAPVVKNILKKTLEYQNGRSPYYNKTMVSQLNN